MKKKIFYAASALALLGVAILTAIATNLSGTEIRISGAGRYACALASQRGIVECWGNNDFGQLGVGTTGSYFAAPQRVEGLAEVRDISARTFHTCAVMQAGTVRCWGRNNFGQLGIGTYDDSPVHKQVIGLMGATSVSVGVFHACALLENETVWCWGYNPYGQLGDGSRANSNVPVQVVGITSAVDISSGADHNCAVLRDKTIQCWGWNAQGQIGAGVYTESIPAPTVVPGIQTAIDVAGGDYHTCALVESGQVYCWGLNGESAASPETVIHPHTPGAPPYVAQRNEFEGVIPTITSVERSRNGARVEWNSLGGNSSYNLYIAARSGLTPDNYSSLPGGTQFRHIRGTSLEIPNLDPDTQYSFIVTGNYLGTNNGQLGNGTFFNTTSPAQVVGIDDAAKIVGGYANSCALLSNGQIKCWGRNASGELGVDARSTFSNTPFIVTGIEKATDVTPAPCAALDYANVVCWGSNYYGQLGTGDREDHREPTHVIGLFGDD